MPSLRLLLFSLSINSEGRIAATGQRGMDVCIAVWDAVTCDALSVIHDAHCFLASAGGESESAFIVIEEVEFHPEHSFELITCGETGVHQRSVAFLSNDVLVSGSSGGHLLVWIDGKVSKILEDVHPGGVTSLETFRGGIITGGNDGTVKIFDEQLNKTAEIPNNPSLVYRTASSIQSLSSFGDKLGDNAQLVYVVKKRLIGLDSFEKEENCLRKAYKVLTKQDNIYIIFNIMQVSLYRILFYNILK
ncbi:hypothetical protein Avbf_06665 [Armadillidium vulgare]|nr:hypothetical protein Avbf_06665 [Armadillidium vulgare]